MAVSYDRLSEYLLFTLNGNKAVSIVGSTEERATIGYFDALKQYDMLL